MLEIITWANEVLNDSSFDSEVIVQTPWSAVIKINTSDKPVYLKQTPKMFFLEPDIIQMLAQKFHAPVPTIIAINHEQNCFLMTDEGKSLREILKRYFDEALVLRAIEPFVSLQINASDYVDMLIEKGVPDYRLEQLPHLYMNLISQKDLLTAEGLSDDDIIVLEEMAVTVFDLCDQLSRYGIKETIVQPDFNDANTVIDESKQKISMIDLGEIVISHPFFSLLNFLRQMKKHHGLTDEDHFYLKLEQACFKNYQGYFDTQDDFQVMLSIAKKVNVICALVYEDRFMRACGKENLISYQHWKLGDLLRVFMSFKVI